VSCGALEPRDVSIFVPNFFWKPLTYMYLYSRLCFERKFEIWILVNPFLGNFQMRLLASRSVNSFGDAFARPAGRE
jgi:hypothetical protein